MNVPRKSLAKILAPAGLALLAALPGAAPVWAADPFYSGLLREGIHDYDSADYGTAVRHLRLACFGMLDEPEPLVDCLARLALAQDKGGDPEGFRETFRRIVEVEERFGSYTRAQLPAALKTAFEQRAAVLVPASTLSAVPAFQALARKATPPGKPAAPSQARAETRNDPKPAPATSKQAAGAPAGPAPAAPTPTPAQPAPATPASTPAPKPLADADKQKMAEARRLLGNEGKISELRQAFDAAKQVADAHPESAEAQHLAAETAYRISRWSDSASYFKRGGEPGADQPELLFYMAVALYESGDRPGAAAVLRRCLPNLQRTSYVDGYARKILGETGAP